MKNNIKSKKLNKIYKFKEIIELFVLTYVYYIIY